MGLREIEDRMKMRELMKKKAAELRMVELENKAAITKMTKEKMADIAKKHGVIIALDPEMQGAIDEIRQKYNIPKERIIKEQMTEDKVLKGGKKVDIESLGMLAYQRVMLEKSETGGLLTIPDVFDRVNTGVLAGKISIDDVEKAVKILKKNNVIPEMKQLASGVWIVSFFPVQYTEDQAKILELVKADGVITTAEVCKALNWSIERTERTLQNLVDTRVARITETFREGKQYFFPNLEKK
jgi:predicted HTH transcriptional regulator